MDILKSLWQSLKGFLASKKALAAVLSVVVYLLGKVGLELDVDELLPAVTPLWLYILGQGVADLGKSAALVNGQPALKKKK